ncbi:MAG: hypothetical protein IT583_01145 [Verrucomicrobia bacterium]|nr:hypothetical protein [Verrucomicrobiota bacterium]
MSPQKYWNVIYRYVAMAVLGLALAGILFAFLPKVNQFRSYQNTKNALDADIRAKEEAIKELRIKQERFGTDKYFVQQIAHETGYAHDGETIYQFNEKTVTNLPPSANREKTP